MLDPITLVEVGGGAVGFLSAAIGGRVGYSRSRRHHQGEAAQARARADEQFVKLNDPLSAVGIQVDGVRVLLGPRDTVTFDREVSGTLVEARDTAESYAAYAYSSEGKTSPGDTATRRQYIEMTDTYNKFVSSLAKAIRQLAKVSNRCEQLTADIEALPGVAEAVLGIISSADAILVERETGGWVVLSMRAMLDEARGVYNDAEESRAACEFITAINEYNEARKQASTAASNARELPKKQQALVRKVAGFERQSTDLQRLIGMARSSIPILLASYDDACARGLAETVDAAVLQLEQFTQLNEELRLDTDPQRDAWDIADTTVKRMERLAADITSACKEVIDFKAALDAQLQDVKTAAAKLDARIQKLYGSISNRDFNGDQARVRRVLECVEAGLRQVMADLTVARPNPQGLLATIESYANLVTRINKASRAIDESDYSDGKNILKGVKTTGAQLGIDFSNAEEKDE